MSFPMMNVGTYEISAMYCDYPNLTCAWLYGMVAGKPSPFILTVPIAEAWGLVRPVTVFSSNMEVSGHTRTIGTCTGIDGKVRPQR
jgi:hypothetical protein